MNLKLISLFAIVTFLSFASVQHVKGQAAILALLFGDKVASENFNLSMEIGGAWTTFSNVPNADGSKFGINFGIAGNVKLSENWFISPGAYFLAKRNMVLTNHSLNSGNPTLDGEFTNVETAIGLRYIDVPIFFSYQSNSRKFRYSIAPQISFLQSSEALLSGADGDFTQDFKPFTNSTDYGVIADFAYILGKAHEGKGIHVHARYYFGFTDIFNDQLSTNDNRASFFSLHISLPFITDELAAKNLEQN